MSDAATLAGVSRPTLYRYYPTKDDLLRAIARHEQRRFDEGLARAIDGRAGEDQLDAALRYLVDFLDGHAYQQLVSIEPGFVLERMATSLPAQRKSLVRLLGDALAQTPP